MKAKKRFGQNFLQDKNIARKIVSSAEIAEKEQVWEIGPGKGILTDELLKHTCQLTCFEIDNDIIPYLKTKYSNELVPYNHTGSMTKTSLGSLIIINKDILKIDWEMMISDNNHNNEKIVLVANIPYNITSPLLYKLCEFKDHFRVIILMIQKEVAERLTSKPKNKNYGVLSLKIQYCFNIFRLFIVPPHLFYPKPAVDSMVIKLIPRTNQPLILSKNDYPLINDITPQEDTSFFWEIIKTSFKSRRKTLRNNLKIILNSAELNELENNLAKKDNSLKIPDLFSHNQDIPINNPKFNLSSRGEDLSEEDFVYLYYNILNILNK